jgi:phenylalanine-4-hydroxylase
VTITLTAPSTAPALIAYTSEDRSVWHTLFERQRLLLPGRASAAVLSGMHEVGLTQETIPQLSALTERFSALTGWAFVPVSGIVPDRSFFELLAQRRFPITTWLRSQEQLDYLAEPDFFHDCYGHVPLLANEAFSDFLQGLAEVALPYLGRPALLELVTRLYWFTVEFGLIQESDGEAGNEIGGIRIYGAGILSSVGETAYSLGDVPERRAFDLQQVMATPYRKDSFQHVYFVIRSYDQLYESLAELRRLLPRLARIADEAAGGAQATQAHVDAALHAPEVLLPRR